MGEHPDDFDLGLDTLCFYLDGVLDGVWDPGFEPVLDGLLECFPLGLFLNFEALVTNCSDKLANLELYVESVLS